MSLKKRCIIGEGKGKLNNQLEYISGLSISIGRIAMSIYYCKGDKIHPAHFVRVDYGKQIATLNKRGKVIPEEQRQRLFGNDLPAQCITGKVKMTLRKILTKNFNEKTIDIYWCKGRIGSHQSHLARVSHGVLPNSKLGLLVFTLEK